MAPAVNSSAKIGDLDQRVVAVWRMSGRTPRTIVQYLVWVRRFRMHVCRARGVWLSELTRDGATRFAGEYIGRRTGRHLGQAGHVHVRTALHAWSCALQVLHVGAVPEWTQAPPAPRPLTGLLAEYHSHRVHHGGVGAASLLKDREAASRFLGFLRARGRDPRRAGVADLDQFVASVASQFARRTAAGICSSLRTFLRFLHLTGRLQRDLARSVVAPRVRPMEHPPRAMPWVDVRRLLRAVKRHHRGGRRDFAVLLLMATYGLGAGEVVRVRFEDIDWTNRVLRIRRPKTGVQIVLPLLPAIARALASYIQHERPPHAPGREVFVCTAMPHRPITSSSSIYYLVRKHARAAGIKVDHLGSHCLRHSHACRQIDAGANPKIVSDIMGHRHPSSISAYVRVALRRLRQVALSVP